MPTEIVERGAPAVKPQLGEIEQALVQGDLAKLTPAARVHHYLRVCEHLGLNPATQPFGYIVLNNKLSLYAKKDATDQLRKIHGVSVKIVEQKIDADVLFVKVEADTADGRHDEDVGAVSLVFQKVEKVTRKGPDGKDRTESVVVQAPLEGDARANAVMKAITKAKRRVTLSICGLGMLDESELETVAQKTPMPVVDQQILRAVSKVPEGLEPADVQPVVAADKQPISEAQYQRFVAFATRVGLDLEPLRAFYQVDNLRNLTVADFKDAISRVLDAHSHESN